MQSKGKKAPTAAERRHIETIKAMPCVVCWAEGPSEAHEMVQGLWYLAVPLCADCHRGSHNGIHGLKAMWKVRKMDELLALNETLRKLHA